MRFSELDGAQIGVWGAGREIAAFAEQLARSLPTARIAAAVFDSPPDAAARERLRAPDARILTAAEAVTGLDGCDVLVRSPGVPVHRAELQQLRAAGIPVTTATALWLAERGGAGVIGVTGTKGKSTTAALVFQLARASGRSAELAGNIGLPAIELLGREAAQVTVLELSSYQTADLEVGPEVVLLTNLFREHTDWHGSEAAYRSDKLRILDLPGVRARVINARDEGLGAVPAPPHSTYYGRPEGWDVRDGSVALAGEPRASLAELPLRGEHNALNLCSTPTLPAALEGFRAPAHRLEQVCDRDGVLWVDDSISTTPESTLAALASFPGREPILIAGGQDRGQDFAALARALAGSTATLIALPTTGPRLLAAARDAGLPDGRALQAPDMPAAVALAAGRARSGAVVLLSPAAPSYDRYRNFEERGEHFRALAERP